MVTHWPNGTCTWVDASANRTPPGRPPEPISDMRGTISTSAMFSRITGFTSNPVSMRWKTIGRP